MSIPNINVGLKDDGLRQVSLYVNNTLDFNKIVGIKFIAHDAFTRYALKKLSKINNQSNYSVTIIHLFSDHDNNGKCILLRHQLFHDEELYYIKPRKSEKI